MYHSIDWPTKVFRVVGCLVLPETSKRCHTTTCTNHNNVLRERRKTKVLTPKNSQNKYEIGGISSAFIIFIFLFVHYSKLLLHYVLGTTVMKVQWERKQFQKKRLSLSLFYFRLYNRSVQHLIRKLLQYHFHLLVYLFLFNYLVIILM